MCRTCDAAPLVGRFSWLDYPNIVHLLDFLLFIVFRLRSQFLSLATEVSPGLVELFELFEFGISFPVLDVEGQGNELEGVLSDSCVIALQVIVEGLFV